MTNIIELLTVHGPQSHYARHIDGSRMTQSFRTEVELVQHLKKKHAIDFQEFTWTTHTDIPNVVFSHHWVRKGGIPLEIISRQLNNVEWSVFVANASPGVVHEIKAHLNRVRELVKTEEDKWK